MIVTTAYTNTDFDRLCEISDQAYTGDEVPPRDVMKDMVNVCDIFLAKTPADYPLYAEANMIIGFALVRTSGNPYIWSIAVAEDFQGRGVGGNLLREIIRKYTLQKERQITLHVHEDNPAQKLYFDYGFRVRRVVENYYDPKDGLLMRRLL